LKKPADSVWFYKQKTEKTKPNRTEPKPKKIRKKPSQTEETEPKPSQKRKNQAKTRKTKPNQVEPVFALKNKPKPVGLTRFRFCFFLILVWLFVLIKTEPNRK
jgi:hypothetical protein